MLWCMNPGWTSAIIDFERAVLQGQFKNGKELVPDGFEEYYSGDVVLCMNVLLCGTNQATYCFLKTFVRHVKNMTYEQLQADP